MGRLGTFALLGSAIAAICATALGVSASASAGERNSPGAVSHEARFGSQEQSTRSSGGHASRILASHNAERMRLRLPPLKWNRRLESEAADWANWIGQRGRLEHASGTLRNGTGENVWMGSAGVWDVETMVGMFLEEREHYRHGNFPEISRTGNWADVGHYTQVIWRDTKEVGCAVATTRGNDVLVCRYWPAGNVWGARAY